LIEVSDEAKKGRLPARHSPLAANIVEQIRKLTASTAAPGEGGQRSLGGAGMSGGAAIALRHDSWPTS